MDTNMIGPIIRVPISVQEKTIAHIRHCGTNHEEGLVAWSGIMRTGQLIVRNAIVPSNGVIKEYMSLRFSDETIEQMADDILSKGEKLIAQVHSHPFEAFHSETDNQFPLVHRKGFLSIVIPYFGKSGFEDFNEFRVYEYVQNNEWIELDLRLANKRFDLEGRKNGAA
jgi:proteasome lid subunit RPN8/RPN11